MPSNEILLTFLVATAIIAYMPGPAMLYAAARRIYRLVQSSLGHPCICYTEKDWQNQIDKSAGIEPTGWQVAAPSDALFR